jgi:glutamate/tyrosine decarboxylase-like PLP-dependent enzyme
MALDLSQGALDEFDAVLGNITSSLSTRHASLSTLPVLPPADAIRNTIASLPVSLPAHGLGTAGAIQYLQDSILSGCLQAQTGPRYFGFVTGGVTPAAQLADVLAGSYDENVQVTLPGQTAATAVEARVLELVLDLIGVERGRFEGRTLTTGATASNVLGLGT